MSATTRVGTEVAGYRLEKVLGRGGMSVVYLAEHIRLGRKVALKLLAPALSEDESYRERFVRESRRAAELDHPNIIPIYDAGEEDGQLYIAMRYVDGSDLKTVIKREGPLQLGRVLFLLEQIASALDAAHEHDLVHRDVKPSNILVSEPSDRVYLTDFGVVKHTLSRGLTKTGFFIGTVDYAAPEQIEGLPLDPRTDVYALGCVFYECLAGRAPYDREGEVAVMHAHLTEPPPRITTARPDLPKALNQVVATAMAKAKEERYDGCEEFVAAARDAAFQRASTTRRELPSEAVQPSAPEPPPAAEPIEEPEPIAEAPVAGAETSGAGAQPPAATTPETPSEEPEPSVVVPAAPPAAPSEPRPRRRRVSPWLVTGLIAVVAAAGSGIGVYFATKSDSNKTGANPTTPGPGAPAPSQAGLAALIPAPVFKNSCQIQSTPAFASAVQSALCTPPATAAARVLPFYPDRWEVSIFPNAQSLAAAYASLRQQNDIGENFGRCNGVTWAGEGPWLHGAGKPGGRQFCYFEGNVAVIVWSHEKLGQASHIDLLGIAREGGSDHPSLFNWWRFWHHRIGKCQQEGCTARLP